MANPTQVDIPLDELREELGEGVTIEYMGLDKTDAYHNEIGPMENEIVNRGYDADAVLVFVNQNFACHSESIDRNTIEIPPNLEYAIRAARRINDRVIVVLNTADAIATWKWEFCAKAILVT